MLPIWIEYYGVVFPSIFVNSLTLDFKTGDSSFIAHCFAFCLNCSFRSRVCSTDSSLRSACEKKSCSSSATLEEEVVTSMGVVWISSLNLRRIFSVTLSSSLERNSAAVLTEPAMCVFLKLNCNTWSHITCIRECWRDRLCLEKAGDGLVVRQNNCWLCCFLQNVCKLEKCHLYCQKFFWVYGHFKLCWGENFWVKRHGGLRFPLWLYFLIGIVLNHEGISSTSEGGIRH